MTWTGVWYPVHRALTISQKRTIVQISIIILRNDLPEFWQIQSQIWQWFYFPRFQGRNMWDFEVNDERKTSTSEIQQHPKTNNGGRSVRNKKQQEKFGTVTQKWPTELRGCDIGRHGTEASSFKKPKQKKSFHTFFVVMVPDTVSALRWLWRFANKQNNSVE